MMHPVISTGLSRGGILYVVCKVNLISLIDFTTDGGCMKDIICCCLAFIALIKTDGGLVSIDTDPNVVIVDNIFFIFVLMLYLKLIFVDIHLQIKPLGTPLPSPPLPQWPYYLGRFVGLMHTL